MLTAGPSPINTYMYPHLSTPINRTGSFTKRASHNAELFKSYCKKIINEERGIAVSRPAVFNFMNLRPVFFVLRFFSRPTYIARGKVNLYTMQSCFRANEERGTTVSNIYITFTGLRRRVCAHTAVQTRRGNIYLTKWCPALHQL